jgi:hypothetical protein
LREFAAAQIYADVPAFEQRAHALRAEKYEVTGLQIVA